MSIRYTNNAATTLSAGIAVGATSFVVVDASPFPVLGGGDWMYLSLNDEVVKVTATTGTTFTCEATVGAHTSGTTVELRMTAELLVDFMEDEENPGEDICKNVSAGTLLKGTPVYQSGTAGQALEVQAADASNAATMPAMGVLGEDLIAGAEGKIIYFGQIQGVDTSAFGEGDTIYVAAGGGYTNVAPTGEGNLLQNLGKVTKVHATNGGGVVMGAGRTNATPNLNDGNVFIGNVANQAIARALQIADITGLQTTLDGKASTSHTHTEYDPAGTGVAMAIALG